MGGMITLAIEVSQRLRQVKTIVLTEDDLRRHLANFTLTRASGNQVCESLVELTGHPAGVELFINTETKTLLSIQLLVARDLKSYHYAHERMHREFETTNQTTAEDIINYYPSPEHH